MWGGTCGKRQSSMLTLSFLQVTLFWGDSCWHVKYQHSNILVSFWAEEMRSATWQRCYRKQQILSCTSCDLRGLFGFLSNGLAQEHWRLQAWDIRRTWDFAVHKCSACYVLCEKLNHLQDVLNHPGFRGARIEKFISVTSRGWKVVG